jgi:hypothetical protein
MSSHLYGTRPFSSCVNSISLPAFKVASAMSYSPFLLSNLPHSHAVLFLKTAFKYLTRILSRKSIPKFDNSRNFEICKLL